MKTEHLHVTDLSRFNQLNWLFNSCKVEFPYNLSNIEERAFDQQPPDLTLYRAICNAEFYQDIIRFRRIDYAFYRTRRF